MWQEHLSNLAHNPDARAELTRFLEPQRRIFADWAGMMQQGMNGGGSHESSAPREAEGTDIKTGSPASKTHRAGLHMATTLSALLSLPSVWPNLKKISLGSSPNCLANLVNLSGLHPELAPYLTREMALRARNFMQGITQYRNHPARRATESAPIIWQAGTTCLRDYAPHSMHAPVI